MDGDKAILSDKRYVYDVALSYAGEDRDKADLLADALRRRKLNVFYDKYEKSDLWGKNLYSHLSDVYQNKARYCVMLLSQYYSSKQWTRHEREAAQARAFSENEEYILPVRLDNTVIPGIPSTIAYLSWPPESAETIADAILDKLNMLPRDDRASMRVDGVPISKPKTFYLKASLTGHSKRVNSVAISPDGQTIVSGGHDKTVRVWDLHTGALLRTLTGYSRKLLDIITTHTGDVLCVAISPDGQTIVSGSHDKTVRVWDLHTGALLRSIATAYSDSVAISANEPIIVSASNVAPIVKVWNLNTGKLLRTLHHGIGMINTIAISSDGQTIVSGYGIVTVWDLHTGEILRALKGHTERIFSVAISPDGQTIVSGSQDKTVGVWNLHTGELLRTLTGHRGGVSSVAFSSDGQIIVSGSQDGTVRVWNLHTGDLLRTLAGHRGGVSSVAISPDGQTIVSGGHDKTINIYVLI